MLGLQSLTAAIRRLADNVNQLAATAAEVNAGVRGRLLLDGQGEDSPEALDHHEPEALPGPEPARKGNGRQRQRAD